MTLKKQLGCPTTLLTDLVASLPRSRGSADYWQLARDPRSVVIELARSIAEESYEFAYQGRLVDKPLVANPTATFWPNLESRVLDKRGVTLLKPRDRIVQRGMFRLLRDPVRDAIGSEVAYGVLSRDSANLGSIQAMATRIAEGWKSLGGPILRADIRQFFPSIDQVELLTKLEGLLPDDSLQWLVERYLRGSVDIPIGASDDQRRKYWPKEQGVPQGTLLASLLSSLYLADFDSSLSRDGMKAFRYVDDLVILCGDKNPEQIFTGIQSRLGGLGLTLHDLGDGPGAKSMVVDESKQLTAVGFRISSGGRIRPSLACEERAVKRFVLSFLRCDGKPKVGFAHNAYDAVQGLTSWYYVFRDVVGSNYWEELDSRISKCASRIVLQFPEMARFRSKAKTKELMAFLGVPRLASLRRAYKTEAPLDDAELELLLQDGWEPT